MNGKMKTDRRFTAAAVILILILAASLRLVKLHHQDMWGDEACMLYLCSDSPAEIVDALVSQNRPDVDVAPPVYFLILHAWMKTFGRTVIGMRSFSVLAGILCALFTFSFVLRTNRDLKTATLAGMITAVSAFHLWYSQEARMYTFAAMLVLLSNLYFYGLFAQKKKSSFLPWFFFSLTALYTQYYAVMALTAQFLFVIFVYLINRKNLPLKQYLKENSKFFIGCFLFLILFAPWLQTVLVDYSMANAPGGFASYFHPLFTIPFLFLKFSMFGNQEFIFERLPFYVIGAAAFLTALAGILKRSAYRSAGIVFSIFMLLFPVILVYSAALVGLKIYKSHPFLIFSPYFYHLAATGLMNYKNKKFKTLLITVILAANLFTVINLNYSPDYRKPRVREALASLKNKIAADAPIYKLPAAIPAPLETMGDFLVWKYYNQDELNVIPMTGMQRDDLMARFPDTLNESEEFAVVYQDNLLIKQDAEKIVRFLSDEFRQTDHYVVESRMRGFSLIIRIFGPGEVDPEPGSGGRNDIFKD